MSSRLTLVEDTLVRHPTLPREAIVKEDILRTGLAFSPAALAQAAQAKAKAYFISSSGT